MPPFFLPRLLCLIAAGALLCTNTYANDNLERELLARIAKSQTELAATEKKVAQERGAIAAALDKKQQQVKQLRTQAAALQRLTDEQLLGLDQLQQRVDQWASQNNYQKHILNSYAENIGLRANELPTLDGQPRVDAQLLTTAFNHVEVSLNPKWHEEQIVSSTGAIVTTPVLSVGPVEVAFNPASGTGGLVSRATTSEPRVLDIFSAAELRELQALNLDGKGHIPLDPTLGNALQISANQDGLITHLRKGGVWALPIIFFGLLSFAIALLKSWQFMRLPKVDGTLTEKLQELTAEQRNQMQMQMSGNEFKQKLRVLATSAGAAQQKMVQIALSSPVSQQRDDLLVAYLMEYKHKLERYMGIVATSAAVAPLLGLLGTVSGMISTFQMMTIFGSGDASTVSGGISEALITTELGLIVAIPSLVVNALLTRKTKSYSHQLEDFAIKLSKIEFTPKG